MTRFSFSRPRFDTSRQLRLRRGPHVVTSPDGTQYRIKVSDSGLVSTELVAVPDITPPLTFPDASSVGYLNDPEYPGSLTAMATDIYKEIESDTTYEYIDFTGWPAGWNVLVGSSSTPVENVTFRGCRFKGRADGQELLVALFGSNITFEYCSFEPSSVAPPVAFAAGYQYGIAADGAYSTHVEGLVVDHCDFWGYANAITLAYSSELEPVIVRHSWFHDHRDDNGGVDHTDGIGELQGGADMSHVVIHNNSIVDTGNTQGIAFQYGPYYDFTITDNRIGGWGYAVAVGGPDMPSANERITFTGNHWTDEVANVFGPVYPGEFPFYEGAGSVWGNNVWEPTGQFWTPTGPSDTDYTP